MKTSANVAETSQGIDAGKKIKGRKRHLITDTLGLVLAVLVTAANVHDTTGGKLLLDDVSANHPSVSKVWADGGYQNSIFNNGALLGIDVEVVQRPRAKGFEPLPKRWVIERDLRLADAAPAPGPGLRSPAPEIPGNDPLGDG